MDFTCRYFDEDAVCRINKQGRIEFGLVIENSEFISSDEEENELTRQTSKWEPMKRGHVRIAWHPKGKEELLPERKVKLYDRSLMPGDIICRLVEGKETQLGYCRNVDVKATVQIVGTKQVITGISSRDLKPLKEIDTSAAVFLDSWVGMVHSSQCDVTLRFNDGSRCILSDSELIKLDDVLERRHSISDFGNAHYYPGQRLQGPFGTFIHAKWLNISKKVQSALSKPSKNVKVVVESAELVQLRVRWFCRSYHEATCAVSESDQPEAIVLGEKLKRIKIMNILEPCASQIGDRNYYVIKDTDRIISLREWKNEMTSTVDTQCDHVNSVSAKYNSNAECESAENHNVDVVEKVPYVNHADCDIFSDDDDEDEEVDNENFDGSTSDTGSATSQSTASTSSVDRFRDTPRSKKGPSLGAKLLKKKKLKKSRRKQYRNIPLNPGDDVVTETLITESKAHVVWQDGTVEKAILSSDLYPIHHLDGNEFFSGDFVIQNIDNPKPHEYGVVKKVDHNARTAIVTWMKTYLAGAEPHPEVLYDQEVSVYDIKDHPDFQYKPGSCVIKVANFEVNEPTSVAGQVIDVHPSGMVEVYWVSGKSSLCYPQELYRIGEMDSQDWWWRGDDFSSSSDEDDSWETESVDSLADGDTSDVKEGACKDDGKNDQAKTKEKKDYKFLLSTGDNKSVQEKLLANIEKLRAGMARLEEVFTQNPTLQTCNVMRRLLELYKDCKVLDQLLGSTYFHESHLQLLVERMRQRGRVNSVQHMADQISRLFSAESNSVASESDNATKSPYDELNVSLIDLIENVVTDSVEEQTNHDSNDVACASSVNSCVNVENFQKNDLRHSSSVTSPTSPLPPYSVEPRNACQQLCCILKTRLLKAHEDVELRFGMSSTSVTSAMQDMNNDNEQREDSAKPVTESELKLNTIMPLQDEDKGFTKTDEGIMSTAGQGIFSILESVPDSHKYKLSILQPVEPRAFFKTVQKEIHLLRSSLPEGIIVKGFEDRLDLYSVLIKGPKRTPYEDGIFLFDFQLPAEYPKLPPSCYYISYCSDKLNPNLYEGGKVCVSLLGTWEGKGTEVWSPSSSNLLQVIISIQGLILVAEPYFNEAGYERQRSTQLGKESSRIYNEMVILKLVQAMSRLIISPPEIFKEEIMEHFKMQAPKLIRRLERWLEISEDWNKVHPLSPTTPTTFRETHGFEFLKAPNDDVPLPEFPLIPASKGLCITLRKAVNNFKEILSSLEIRFS